MRELLHDLASEHEVLDYVLNHLKDENWDVPSPAEGWTLRDCVSHLAELDELATIVVNERFFPERSENPGGGALTMAQLEAYGKSPTEMVSWWRESAQDLIESLTPLDPSERLPWFGPPMSARSFASGRILEAWSHGLDILDAAGVEPQDTDRLKNIEGLNAEYTINGRGYADVLLSWDERIIPLSQEEVRKKLQSGSPRVSIYQERFATRCLEQDELIVATERVRQFFQEEARTVARGGDNGL